MKITETINGLKVDQITGCKDRYLYAINNNGEYFNLFYSTFAKEIDEQKISDNPPTVRAVIDYVNYKMSGGGAITFLGSKTCAEISDLNVEEVALGSIYNVLDNGIITYTFNEVQKTLQVRAGDNVAWSVDGWDSLAGFVDLSDYVTQSEVENIVNTAVTAEASTRATTDSLLSQQITANTQAIAGKADSDHTHTKSQITDFSHSHGINDVNGLSGELNSKASTTALNNESTARETADENLQGQITANASAIEDKADADHTHQISEVTNLQSSLDGKISAVAVDGKSILGDGKTTPLSGVGQVYEVDGVAKGEIFNTYEGNFKNEASGDYSHAEGYDTRASGDYSHAEGDNTTASEWCSHAEGSGTTASGYYSHAEGSYTTASGDYSHAEGYDTTASGDYSHAEGDNTTASEWCSHAEGSGTTASGDYSHAEGSYTTASGDYSHAEGYDTTASGYASHAEGYGTIANGYNQHVGGKYNVADITSLEIIGNGTDDNNRSNARKLDANGNETLAGDIIVQNTRNLRAEIDNLNTSLSTKATISDISNSINALDVSQVGNDDSYISKISETNGKISASSKNFNDSVATAMARKYGDNTDLYTELSTPVDSSYVLAGFDSNKKIEFRRASSFWDYIKSKISSVLGLTADSYNGGAKTLSYSARYTTSGSGAPRFFKIGTMKINNAEWRNPASLILLHCVRSGTGNQFAILKWGAHTGNSTTITANSSDLMIYFNGTDGDFRISLDQNTREVSLYFSRASTDHTIEVRELARPNITAERPTYSFTGITESTFNSAISPSYATLKMKLADYSITTSQLMDDVITNDKLSASIRIQGYQIASRAVWRDQIGDNALVTRHFQIEQIEGQHIKQNTITPDRLTGTISNIACKVHHVLNNQEQRLDGWIINEYVGVKEGDMVFVVNSNNFNVNVRSNKSNTISVPAGTCAWFVCIGVVQNQGCTYLKST